MLFPLPKLKKEEIPNMRNLKKILALVLALVMSLSLMMTASAATDFKDDGSIEDYRLAIEVLHGLGVFNGDQDGNFNPKSEITRAEVAAIIYRIAWLHQGTWRWFLRPQ